MLGKILQVLKQKPPVQQGASLEDVRLMAARAAQRQKVGSGQFGQVYEGIPGSVIKEIPLEEKDDLINEINLQAKAAELGIAPRIQETYMGPPQIGDTKVPIGPGPNPQMRGKITMQDLRQNYTQLGTPTDLYNPQLNEAQIKIAEVETYKQLSQLALNGIALHDRHGQNIFVHNMTGRPMQIDFGLAQKLETPSQRAGMLAYNVGSGLQAAGLHEEASTLIQLVNEVGQFNPMTMSYENPEAALNMAKQGLSRLQKIKSPQIQQIAQYNQSQKKEFEDAIDLLQ